MVRSWFAFGLYYFLLLLINRLKTGLTDTKLKLVADAASTDFSVKILVTSH